MAVDLLAAQRRVGGVVAQLGLALPRLAAADARHQLVELLDLAVAETQHRPDADDFFRRRWPAPGRRA